MNKNLPRALALVLILGLVVPLTNSLKARDPGAQERSHPLRPGFRPRTRDSREVGAKWARTFWNFFNIGGDWKHSEYDRCAAVQPTGDGGIVVAGSATHWPPFPEIGISDLLVMEILPRGRVGWKVLYEADPTKQCFNSANDLIQTRDGGYLVVGEVAETDVSGNHALAIKLGHNGSVQWIKTFGSNFQGPGRWGRFQAVAQLVDGGTVIAGAGNGIWVIKLDSQGQVLWNEILGDDLYISGCSLRMTRDGGFIIIGYSDADGNAEILKFDSGGRGQWHKSYVTDLQGERYFTSGAFISPTNEGGFILGGSIHYSDDGHTAFAGGWLCKLDQSGLITWQRGYYDFIPGYIIQTIDGGYLETSGGGGPGGIIKLDSSGANQWIRFVPSSAAFQTDDEGYVMFFGDYFYNPLENEKFGVLCVDRDGMIGPSCSLIMNGSYSEMNPLIREASGTAIGPYEDSIWVQSDGYIPFPRSCHQVETICSYQLRE